MRSFPVLILLLILIAPARADDVSFQHDVWPIFKRHCIGCHSAQKTKGRLRMDDVVALLKGGKTGPLFVAGKPDDSFLIEQITGDSPEMPQNEAPLSRAKVKLLRDWIAQGAKIDGPPKSDVPPVVIPAIYASAPAVSSVTLSPDGKTAAVACRSEVVLFNVDDDLAPRRLPTDFDLITHVEFSPDGQRLAVAGGSPQQFGGLILFTAADGKKESERHLGTDTFFKGNFAPDGQTIALGGATGAISLIPVDEKGAVKNIELHSDWVTAVAYTADGKQLVSGSRDKTIKISSVENLSLLRSVDQSTDCINAVAADPLDAIAGGNARALTGYDFKLALTGIEVSGSGNGARPVNNLAQYVRPFEAQAEAIMALAVSADRKLLAVATRAPELRLYDTTTRARKATLPKVPAPVLSVALNADGTRLILGTKSGLVQVWDVATAKLIKELTPVPVQPAELAGK
ncbi:MAG TPA: c-type cytochrome domain-containing protein [Chthoniobacteraceae bacterium]|nr:c-type cytochrome domain-containing protein [Chthoniobacteraceae bacterium]